MDFELNLTTETVQQAAMGEPLCVEAGATLGDALLLLKQHRQGSLLICRDGTLVGIFTERDALRLMAQSVPSGLDLDVPIEDVMISDPVTVVASDTVATAIRKMASGGYRRLPIVDSDGRPASVVKASGIVRYLVEHFPHTVYNLPPDPNPAMQEREGA